MTTIEERAEEASKILMREEHRRWYRVGYIHAVAEQQKIDIEKACKWLMQNAWCDGTEYRFDIAEFRKAMMED